MSNQRMNVDLSQATDLHCSECNNRTFIPVFVLKRLSAIVSPNGQEMMVPVQLYECTKCHMIPDEFLSAFGDE